MVAFDNLARILQQILQPSLPTNEPGLSVAVLEEWKLLGQEAKGQLTVAWIERSGTSSNPADKTCIGLYRTKPNSLRVLCKIPNRKNIIQASVNDDQTLVSYVVKESTKEENESTEELYHHYVVQVKNLEKSESDKNSELDNHSNLGFDGIRNQRQIMSNFIGSASNSVSKLLLLVHLESITLYRLKNEANSEKVTVVKLDAVTKSFIWAQWDCHIQALYFIHFRKTSAPIEGEDTLKQDDSPTLSCFQFHEDLPHETVLNVPLNLPSIPKSTDTSCQIYEDDPIPLRIHDCSLDLVVISDEKGTVCICHHYLYKPAKALNRPETEENTVHLAYSVTLLHHGSVIHSAVPGIPWNLAKTMRPVFAFLGGQYLVVYAAGVFTHLLDIGLSHEPNCHILMKGPLTRVPVDAARLVVINATFTNSSEVDDHPEELMPSIMIDISTLDLIEFDVDLDDLLTTFAVDNCASNRLSIIHYLLVHAEDFEALEEALSILCKNPTDINLPKYFQEILIGGAYCLSRRRLPPEAGSLANLLPMTCEEPALASTEKKVKQTHSTITHEVLWNTAMMLLSPQQRLKPFITDIWRRLWDRLIKPMKNSRFRSNEAVEKLLISLGCFQPEALSCCTTPMSPSTCRAPMSLDAKNEEVSRGSQPSTSEGGRLFTEADGSIASQQEHITSVNMRELSLHLLKNGLCESPEHVHLAVTCHVSAQLEVSKILRNFLGKIAGVEDVKTDKGFALIKSLHPKHRYLLFMYYQRYYNAASTLAYPLPPDFTSFFCYLGFSSLPFCQFIMYLQNNVFDLQVDVMKEVMKDIEDTDEGVNKKLRLLLLMPRTRAKRLLYGWPHGVSLMIRAREHALNILSGVPSSHCQGLSQTPRRLSHISRGLAAFPSADKLSPLDTFLDLLTAKASLADLDFNLLIDATISSTQDFYR